MAKLVLFGAFLAVLVVSAQASRFTVTTTITEEQPQQEGRCMEEIRPHKEQLRSCQNFLTAPFERQEASEKRVQHDREECCEGLEKIREEQCRCEAMSSVVKDIESMERRSERGPGLQQGHEQKMKLIREAASNLPNQCNIGGPQQCQIEQPRLIRMVRV